MRAASSAVFYARAILEMALKDNRLQGWRKDLGRIADVASEGSVQQVVEDGTAPIETKQDLVREKLVGVAPAALAFALDLLERGRLSLATDICREYERAMDAQLGIDHARVVTAIPLSKQEVERVSDRIAQRTGSTYVVDVEVDPEVLGGLRIRIGDTMIDRTLRARLESLRGFLKDRAA